MSRPDTGVAINTDATAQAPEAKGGALKNIELTLVDPDATFFGTFQSHNQKVVANNRGIFITYMHYIPDPETTSTTNIWRLARSTDGGLSFNTIYEGHYGSRAPAIETDENDNIYLAFPDWTLGNGTFHFMRLLAAENYQTPHITSVTGAWSDAKHAMAYDPTRHYFHIATQYGALWTVRSDGVLINGVRAVWGSGPNGYPQYPNLHVDSSGTLYFGDTNVDTETWKIYRSIHCIKSTDGGATWQRLDGTPVATPVAVDETGEGTMISEMSEFYGNTWLCNTITKGGRTHFFYASRNPAGALTTIPYMNYDTASGARQDWQDLMQAGDQVIPFGYDGFFSTPSLDASTPLYVVLNDNAGRMSALESFDNGHTWHDYARGTQVHWAYATGGSRLLTPDGYIIGAYCAPTGPGGVYQIWFLRIKTDAAPNDSDDDGLPDAWETNNGLDPRDGSGLNGANGDPDQDGLDNLGEYHNGTDPLNADTDGDGSIDGTEVLAGTDPNDSYSCLSVSSPTAVAVLAVVMLSLLILFLLPATNHQLKTDN